MNLHVEGHAPVTFPAIRSRLSSCATASCRRRHWRPRTRSCSTGQCSASASSIGGDEGCESASPTAASTSRIAAMSGCWRRGAPPATGCYRSQQRRLDAKPQGQDPSDKSGRSSRGGARRARSRRSGRRIRGGHAARADQARAAGGAGQGRRLQARRGRGARSVEAAGGDVILVDPVPGHSTTAIVSAAGERTSRGVSRACAPSFPIASRTGPRLSFSPGRPPVSLSSGSKRAATGLADLGFRTGRLD